MLSTETILMTKNINSQVRFHTFLRVKLVIRRRKDYILCPNLLNKIISLIIWLQFRVADETLRAETETIQDMTRDETFVIRGETETRPRRLYKRPRRDRDETFVLLLQALHGTMRDACAAMPHNTPPPPPCHFLCNVNVSSNELHAQVTL